MIDNNKIAHRTWAHQAEAEGDAMIQADTASNDFPADIVTPAHVATLITPGLSPVSICDARDRGASRLDPRVTASHELRITVELDEPDPKDAR